MAGSGTVVWLGVAQVPPPFKEPELKLNRKKAPVNVGVVLKPKPDSSSALPFVPLKSHEVTLLAALVVSVAVVMVVGAYVCKPSITVMAKPGKVFMLVVVPVANSESRVMVRSRCMLVVYMLPLMKV